MNKKKVYLIGIKGVGMASLAVYLKEKGYEVSGSDSPEIFQTDSVLKKFHIEVFDGFKKTNLPEYIDLVIYSAAYTSKNEELTEAKLRGLKILSLGQALGLFMKGNTQVSIAGTHGKTTSAALAAWTLKKVGFDPSYFIGCAKVTGLIAPGHFGTDKVFIAEADEYVSDLQIDRKPKFLWQNPSYLLITNIDFDHPDVFADLSKVQDAFRSFIKNVTKDGFVFIN
ncbi:MAG: Mur ligase domain-containing protein, partial [Actinobacteria bacterium]|nr:Mur ligase domain-containing protein [Actinomycetota bacterium]